MLFLLDPRTIQPTNNQNFGNVDDPQIARELAALEREQDLDAAADDWSALDEYVVSPPQSYVAPYGHRELSTFFSERMDMDVAKFHPVYQNDYSTWAIEGD